MLYKTSGIGTKRSAFSVFVPLICNTLQFSIKVIAHGEKIRDINRLINEYLLPNGKKTKIKDWYKVIVRARIVDKYGNTEEREVHWYQADNVGKVEFKFPSNPKQR